MNAHGESKGTFYSGDLDTKSTGVDNLGMTAGTDPRSTGRPHLSYFSREGDLVFDPMAGGGVVADTCLAFGRKCWSFDLADRPEIRPEIEPHRWDPKHLAWPVNGNKKPDLIFFDPPYFNNMADQYAEESISSFSRNDYLKFFRDLFPMFREHSNTNARIAFLNADWREFRGISAMGEDPKQSILLSDYIKILERSGWETPTSSTAQCLRSG